MFLLFGSLDLFAGDSAAVAVPGNSYRNSVLFCVNYARHVPLGTLKNRFGGSNSVGFSTAYKFGHNFQIQGGINTIFSGRVKETGVFDTMIGSSGYMVDINGNLAEIKLYERGWNCHFDFGKILLVNSKDINSGILISGGLGFMQHKIKYTFQRTVLPQLEGEYAKGYDRLTNGLMTRGFFGYQKIDPDAMLNFVFGVEALYGFTKNRRSYNYDTRMADNVARRDIFLGLKLGVMVSLSGRKAGTTKGEEERYFD